MNNDRRKRIAAVQSDLEDYIKEIDDLRSKVEAALSELNDKLTEAKDNLVGPLEEIRDEEQEAFDNMPEGLQQGEKGELAQEAVNNLESAISDLENLDAISEPDFPDLGEISSYLDEASN